MKDEIIKTIQESKCTLDGSDYYMFTESEINRLVELIVLSCVKICDNDYELRLHSNGWGLARDIEGYFGVKNDNL